MSPFPLGDNVTRRAVAIRSAACVLAVVVAVLAALVATDVFRWRGNDVNVRAQLALANGDPRLQPNTLLPSSWTRSLLGVGDAVALNRVLGAWQQTILQPARGTRGAAAVGDAELQLEQLSKSHALSSTARSDAMLLHSILLLNELGGQASTPGQMASIVQRPLVEMQRAVLTDPSNVYAKYDLEVALRLYPAGVFTPQPGEVPVTGGPKGKRGGQGQGGTGDVGGGF